MTYLFSEDFFRQALFGLFIAVTLFQVVYGALVLWFFPAIKNEEDEILKRSLYEKQTSGALATLHVNGQRSTVNSQPSTVNEPIGVSVIICARNEAGNLRQNLPVILEQQYHGPWEMLLIDDASEDETAEVVLELQQQNTHLRNLAIVDKNHPGKKQALAAGISAAMYDAILVTDADCVPASKHWIRLMMAPFASNPKIEFVLGYGPMTQSPARGTLENWTRFETAVTAMQYITFARMGAPYMGVGRNLAFRKSTFVQAGGFAGHEHIASGDDDLLVNSAANKHNTSWCLHPEAFVFSQGKQSWNSWFRQKRRHLSAGKAYKRQYQMLLGLLGLSHTLHFFLFFLLLILDINRSSVLLLGLLRALVFFFVYRKVFLSLRESGLLYLFLMYEMLLSAYLGALVPIFLTAKQSRSWH